jgi:anaerobic magnesium-protoporphyrin IX monomethyl ester cyclase
MDILLTHGYFLYEDPHELQVMKPYPTLGILYISSHLKARGFDVRVFDTTFSSREELETYLERERPPVVGVYCNLMTRPSALRIIAQCRHHGATVIAGGPEPANYPTEYLDAGADVVVIGEGELTLEELLPHLARYGPVNMRHIHGIVYREQDGQVVHTPPRPYIADLSAQPFPDRDAIDIQRYVDVWRDRAMSRP